MSTQFSVVAECPVARVREALTYATYRIRSGQGITSLAHRQKDHHDGWRRPDVARCRPPRPKPFL